MLYVHVMGFRGYIHTHRCSGSRMLNHALLNYTHHPVRCKWFGFENSTVSLWIKQAWPSFTPGLGSSLGMQIQSRYCASGFSLNRLLVPPLFRLGLVCSTNITNIGSSATSLPSGSGGSWPPGAR